MFSNPFKNLFKPKPFRVVRVTRLEKWYGYSGLQETTYQQLRQGHKVIDEETIPEDVLIDLALFGGTYWRSKWADSHPEAYVRRNA